MSIYQKASVIVANYNNGHILSRVLTALEMQACDKDLFEVIISDDGSTDSSREIAENFESSYELKFIAREHQGRSAVRNAGIKISKNPIIILLDSDSVPMYDFVISHVSVLSYFSDPKKVILGLRKLVNNSSITEKMIREYQLRPHAIQDAQHLFPNGDVGTKDWRLKCMSEKHPFPRQEPGFVVSSNMSFFKEIAEKIGLFSEEFKTYGYEDTEFGSRLLSTGCQLILGSSWVFHIEHDREPDWQKQINKSKEILRSLVM